MLNTSLESYPCFSYNHECRPSRELQIEFIETYLNEFVIATKEKFGVLDGNTKLEHYLGSMNLDVEAILIEAAFFELVSHIIFAFWSVCNSSKAEYNNFDYMVSIQPCLITYYSYFYLRPLVLLKQYALARCDAYFKQKQALFPFGFDCVRI